MIKSQPLARYHVKEEQMISVAQPEPRYPRYLPYIELESLALQPFSAGNSAEFSQADNSKTIQRRATNLTSLDSLGFCESIYVHFKPQKKR